MKIHFTICLAIIALSPLYGQKLEMKYENGFASFQKIIHVDSTSTQELYKRCDRWVLQAYKDPDKVVKVRIENEEIRGEGVSMSAVTLSQFPAVIGNLHYTFRLEVKENRVRMTVSNMEVSTAGPGTYPIESYIYKQDGSERDSKQATNVKESATTTANSLILYLESALVKKKDDW